MGAPKAKLNRLWVSVAGNGNVQGWWPNRPAKHPQHGKSVRVVECIPVPRVSVVPLAKRYGVYVNGKFVTSSAILGRARIVACDLRRALRKGK